MLCSPIPASFLRLHAVDSRVDGGIVFSGRLSVRPVRVNAISQEQLDGISLHLAQHIHLGSSMN